MTDLRSDITDISQLDRVEALLERLVTAVNTHTDSLNWLTDNTRSLFDTIAAMNAAGGPSAMLGQLVGGK